MGGRSHGSAVDVDAVNGNSDRAHTRACAANASFSSMRSRSPTVTRALERFRVAGIGPRPMQFGSTPATADVTMRASGVSPRRFASSALMGTTPAEPSLMPLELPAVTLPPSRNAASISRVAQGDVRSRMFVDGDQRRRVTLFAFRRAVGPARRRSPQRRHRPLSVASLCWLSTRTRLDPYAKSCSARRRSRRSHPKSAASLPA